MKQESINYEAVKNLFNKKAEISPDFNSVLDAGQNKDSKKANILHDYFSKRFLLHYLKPKKTDKILDFGCGVGRLSVTVAKKTNQVIGIDAAEQMINVAKKINNRDNISYYTDDELTKIQSISFDKVFTFWVLAHINNIDIEKYAKEFSQLLKHNGTIFIFEQIKGAEQMQSETYIRRETSEYIDIFVKEGFVLEKNKKIIRYPSYARAMWNKTKLKSKLLLNLLYTIEKLTVNRKPEYAEYYTEVFVFKKP